MSSRLTEWNAGVAARHEALITEALRVIASANEAGIYYGYTDILLDNMPQIRDSKHAREIIAELNVKGEA